MKKPFQYTDETLLNYLDGTLSPDETKALEDALPRDSKLQEQLDWLRKSEALFSETSFEKAPDYFTAQVMGKLDTAPVQQKRSSRNNLLLLGGILALVFLASFLVYTGAFSYTTTIDLGHMVSLEQFKNILPPVPLNEKLIVNVIILFNIALAFLVLDRTLLKPWFERRARR